MAANTNVVTAKEFGRRFRKALSVPFLLNQVCSNNVQDFVTSYAASLGCTEKSLFFPMLSCVAACMGTECSVQLSSFWKEPPILWTLVITPKSLLRIDVVEHLKQELFRAQNEVWVIGHHEDTKDHLKKFLFDTVSLKELQDILKLSNGHGLGIYSSSLPLVPNLLKLEQMDVMLRMISGASWFSDSRVNRTTVTKTRVNFAIVSPPNLVQQSMEGAPLFEEVLHQCFLTTCSEESHVKFNELTDGADPEKLRLIFTSLLKLHFAKGPPIIYKLSAEAKEKFSQIHDELTDKAKQMARKNAHKVFQPALAYLGRLSCVLHVLDLAIYAVNFAVPISHLTWNTEISADTVWHARELLGHVIEQRHALMEPTTIENQQHTPRQHNSPTTLTNTPPSTNRSATNKNLSLNNNSIRRNILANSLTNNNGTRPTPAQTPIIESVSSLAAEKSYNSLNSNGDGVTNRMNVSSTPADNTVLPSIPAAPTVGEKEGPIPVLLSRVITSVLDISEEDFLRSHRGSIRKILKHSIGDISTSRCTQLKLTPDPTASEESQKYTATFARSFLKRLESLGFGVCDGAKKGNLRHFVFKKKKFETLGFEQKEILKNELAITEVEYNKCFVAKTAKPKSGGVVCIE